MLSIGAFSKISNVTTKTLRYYDEIGLIKPVYVNGENGYRYYSTSQLETVLLIGKLKWYGFSLDEIAEVLKKPEDNTFILSRIREKEAGLREAAQHYQMLLSLLEKDISNLERGKHIMAYLEQIEVKLVETKPMSILSIRKKMNVRDSQKYMMELMTTVQEKGLTLTAGPMSIFHDEVYDPENYDMEDAVAIREAEESTRILEGGLCVMSVLRGAYTELPSVYAKIREWIEEEGYTVSGAPYEIYQTDPSQVLPEENITEIYVPVKK